MTLKMVLKQPPEKQKAPGWPVPFQYTPADGRANKLFVILGCLLGLSPARGLWPGCECADFMTGINLVHQDLPF
jgi:hypothetical protein